MTRLSLAALRASGRSPALDRGSLSTGVVHLGAGAFFRAHAALLTEDAMLAAGEPRWGICAVTGRSTRVWSQLAPQDGLFTVSERGAGSRPVRVVSSVREVLAGPSDPWAVAERIADPAVRVVTLTVTEKGYRSDPSTGRLDTRDEAVRADLAGGPPRTPVGQIARGLQLRQLRDAGPVSVLSCDNLPENGRRTRALVLDFVQALPEAQAQPLLSWLEEQAAFPSTMVDRMVPATTGADVDRVRAQTGLHDEAAVVAEPFHQWVMEDRFAAPRPRWEEAGARFTADVAPWESAKLRVLNASHSLLAYLGLAVGHTTIAQCVADEGVARAAHRLIHEEVLPTLNLPEGLDGQAYAASVLHRFANPALGHSTAKVAADGSQKFAPRLFPTTRAVLELGAQPRWSALAVAAWAHHVADRRGEVEDPQADALRALLPDRTDAGAVVPALLRARFFPAELTANEVFTDLVRHWYRVIDTADAHSLTKEIAS